ncbi:MAG: uroporphyrinogen decarboxylase family protein, partial [Pseudomonadota bacterium]|nr:uroporphyrinogen decarboxylase family protein [Pseudomonadota bacterium]
MSTASAKPLLDCLNGQTQAVPPVWLMRQAGRYLPEYRALRAEVPDFLTLCFTPDLASEVTLQPIIRYAMDGAILFSDILVIPYALGQSVSFLPGKGPVLAALSQERDIPVFDADRLDKTIGAVYQTVSQVKKRLPAACTLIGFCGGPWTVATYMVEGGSSRDFQKTKTWAFCEPQSFGRLIDVI